MRVVVGIVGALLILVMLAEFFVSFLLPRRVKRDPRIARQVYTVVWPLWRRAARRLPSAASQDTMLGIFGPLALLTTLAVWTFGIMLGFACLHWAGGSKLQPGHAVSFGNDLYYSAGGFLSGSTPLSAQTGFGHVLNILEAAGATSRGTWSTGRSGRPR